MSDIQEKSIHYSHLSTRSDETILMAAIILMITLLLINFGTQG